MTSFSFFNSYMYTEEWLRHEIHNNLTQTPVVYYGTDGTGYTVICSGSVGITELKGLVTQ